MSFYSNLGFAMILMMGVVVTAEFNLTDPCAIGELIQEDHWSRACKLSMILHYLEGGNIISWGRGKSVFILDPCQHVNFAVAEYPNQWYDWPSKQYGSWCDNTDRSRCSFGNSNDAFVWIPEKDALPQDRRACSELGYNTFVNESFAMALVFKKLDDLVLDQKFNLFPQTFVSRRYLEKARTMPLWDPEKDQRFMVEETWAKKLRSLTINCNKALEAAIKVAVYAVYSTMPRLRDFKEILIQVGPGDGPTIVTIEDVDVVYGTLHCPPRVTKENWEGGHSFPNTYDVMQKGNQLTITRTDSKHPWGLDLQFKCQIEKASMASVAAEARERCDDPKYPTNLRDYKFDTTSILNLGDLSVARPGDVCADGSVVQVHRE